MVGLREKSFGQVARWGASVVLILVVLAGCIAPADQPIRQASLGPIPGPGPAKEPGRVQRLLVDAPLLFEENRGQTDAAVGFLARGPAMSAFFTPSGVAYRLVGWDQAAAAELRAEQADPAMFAAATRGMQPRLQRTPPSSWLLQHEPIGGQQVQPTAQTQAETVVSYFRGKPEEWITGAPTYRELTYAGVWPGIDVVYRANGPQLKSGYLVAAGADPGQIQLRYRGGQGRLTERGELEILTGLGTLRESPPVAWQESANGGRTPVAVRFSLLTEPDADTVEYGFALGAYDQARPLVIDPAISFVGHVGGASLDEVLSLTVDDTGATYAIGQTASFAATFSPVTGPDLTLGGSLDAFVVKVNAAGNGVIYKGYVGGAGAGDGGFGIALAPGCASDCDAYLVGQSNDGTLFPVSGSLDSSHNGSYDAFVAKLNATGTAIDWAGFIGGTFGDFGYGIAVDPAGAVYVTGDTASNELAPGGGHGFPNGMGAASLPAVGGFDQTKNGGFTANAYVAKLNGTTGELLYWTYLGGTDASGDRGLSVAADSSGRAYVAGDGHSSEATFPNGDGLASITSVPGLDQTHNGGTDTWVVRLNASGAGLEYLSFVGGASTDSNPALSIDGANAIYLTGLTHSEETSFPDGGGMTALNKPGFDKTRDAGFNTAFAVKLLGTGSGAGDVVWATYLGGTNFETGRRIVVPRGCATNCSAFVAGVTGSTDFNGIAGVGNPDPTHNTGTDSFVVQLAVDGASLVYGTFLGGGASKNDTIFGLGVTPDGRAIVGGGTESDQSTFPTGAGFGALTTFDGSYGGDPNDAYILGLNAMPTATPTPTLTPTTTATATATATPTHTPTPGNPTATPTTCAPRPPVTIQTQPSGANRMQVTVTANTLPATTSNPLVALHFYTFTNGVVDIPNGPSNQSSTFAHVFTTTVSQTTFFVRRPNPSAATHVQFTVQDACGYWRTFVGGGAGAF